MYSAAQSAGAPSVAAMATWLLSDTHLHTTQPATLYMNTHIIAQRVVSQASGQLQYGRTLISVN